MTRFSRNFASVLAILALVFAQLAASAHACALHQERVPAEVTAHHAQCGESGAQEQAPSDSNVCSAHCQYGHASHDAGAPDLPPAALAGAFLRVEPVAPKRPPASRAGSRLVPQAAAPPPSILFGVLRI